MIIDCFCTKTNFKPNRFDKLISLLYRLREDYKFKLNLIDNSNELSNIWSLKIKDMSNNILGAIQLYWNTSDTTVESFIKFHLKRRKKNEKRN